MTNRDNSGPMPPDAAKKEALRDWFAGQALPGLFPQYAPVVAAEIAYAVADAMLAARKTEPKP